MHGEGAVIVLKIRSVMLKMRGKDCSTVFKLLANFADRLEKLIIAHGNNKRRKILVSSLKSKISYFPAKNKPFRLSFTIIHLQLSPRFRKFTSSVVNKLSTCRTSVPSPQHKVNILITNLNL